MRTAFINQLIEEAAHNERIFLIVGDLGFHVVEPFRDRFPNRFLNAGIAEQNMTGVAAGLAREGYNVYIYSIANFPTLRCIEQIRNDVCYYGGNVKIVAVGAGYAYGSLGVSHHATEDVAVMRALPQMTVASPSDPSEARAIATLSARFEGPMYIRLGKAGEKQVFPDDATAIELGQPHCLKESASPNLLLTTGSVLSEAVSQIDALGIDTAVYTLPFVKPLSAEALARLATRHPNMVVLEEHQKSGGIGSAVIERLNDALTEGTLAHWPRIRRLAIDDYYLSTAGKETYMRREAGLTLRTEYFEPTHKE